MKNLIKAAKELNDVLGLDPEIKTVAVKKDVLEKKLKQAATMIEPQDDVSEETIQTLEVLGALLKKAEPAEKPEPAEETNEPETDLVKLIDQATKIKELKVLIENYDEFESLRKTLVANFSVRDLKEDMMELLGEPVEKAEEVPTEDFEKKLVEKKPKVEIYTRMDSVCEALKTHKPKTVDDLIKTADGIFQKYDNESNLKESRYQVNKALQVLKHFDIGIELPK